MPRKNTLTEQQFRDAARSGNVPNDAALRKGFVADVKAIDGEARTVDFVISTASVDRMGDTIAVDGWKLESFRKNPVVLWAHDSSMLPLAKASNVRVEDGKLKARAEFAPREISGMANAVFEMLKAGFLSATSVGFAPLKYAFVDDPERKFGIDFIEQELLEFSIVPIPANAEALIEARSTGIDIAPLREWAEKMFAQEGFATISRSTLDAIKALPHEFRGVAAKLPKSAAGASGIWRRNANAIERAIGPVGSPPSLNSETAKESAGTPALDMARRRLAAIRARLT